MLVQGKEGRKYSATTRRDRKSERRWRDKQAKLKWKTAQKESASPLRTEPITCCLGLGAGLNPLSGEKKWHEKGLAALL